MEWRNIYRGIMMGASDMIPGVSGGTIAVILGIYDRLLEAVSGFFSRSWKRHIGFLLPLVIGAGLALLFLSRFIDYFLAHYYAPTQFFFLGLIIGVLPLLINQAAVKTTFRLRHFVLLIVAAVLIAATALVDTGGTGEPLQSLTLTSGLGLFASGWLASMAMLLPGISGAFILLLLGVHTTAIHALSHLQLSIIAVIGAGVILGFIISSKGIRYLLAHYYHMTYAAIIGLIIGSVFVVFPGFANDTATIVVSVVAFAAGLALTFFVGRRQVLSND